MLSANFKPKRTAAASRGFLATARLSCLLMATITWSLYTILGAFAALAKFAPYDNTGNNAVIL